MLKHSTSHYGTTTTSPSTTPGGLPPLHLQTPHPLTSSSHSGGGDSSYHHHQQHQQIPSQTHLLPHSQSQLQQQQQQQQIDPTRFLEGPPYSQNYNKSYLEQSFPSLHNSRLQLLDSSRLIRSSTGTTTITSTTLPKDLSPDRLQFQHHPAGVGQKANGSIYLSPQSQQQQAHVQQQHPVHISPSHLLHPSSNSINPISQHNLLFDHHHGSSHSHHNLGGGGGVGIQSQSHLQQNLNLNTSATTTAATTGTGTSHNPHSSLLHTSSTLQSASYRHGVLRSLSLLSILSLLLALNSLVFLLKIVWPLNMSGGGGSSDSEFKLMYEVTLCLAAMCLSINLCVLLVTAAQYFFAVSGTPGSTSFLRRVTVIRGVAIGGFFLSIPLFLAALVLYTFTHLSFAIPALVTTFLVGVAIIFGGCAMVCHVVIWQQEKNIKRSLHPPDVSPNPTIELSTLV